MSVYPTEIKRLAGDRLSITWNDGQQRVYTVGELRDRCPCATCREKRAAPAAVTLFPILKPEEARPLTVAGMKPVGNYAYSIEFSDQHDTGIYTFDLLRELGQVVT